MKKQLKRWMAVMTASAMLCVLWLTPASVSAAWDEYPVGKVGVLKYNLESDGTATIVGFAAKVNRIDLVIPSEFNGYTVSKIAAYAFWNCDNLVSVSIPSSINAIGEKAFENCDNLVSVSIPSSVETIREETFAYCEKLNHVEMAEGLKEIGTAAFMYCESLTHLIFPSSLKSLGNHAFSWCKNLSNVRLPKRIDEPVAAIVTDEVSAPIVTDEAGEATLEHFEFSGDTLWCVFENDGTVTINLYSTSNNRVNLVIPSTIYGHKVSKIAANAFWNCDNLVSVSIPSSVESIGENAFEGCDNLVSVSIPSSVESIGKEAFAYCDNLKNVKMAEGIKTIGSSAFMYCESLTQLEFPDSVGTLANHVCAWCKNLSDVTLPKGIDEIPQFMFQHCSALTTIMIGKNIKKIADDALTFGNDNPIIVGYKDTEAEDFAKRNGYPFYELAVRNRAIELDSEEKYRIGDVTTNERIETDDYRKIQQELNEKSWLTELKWHYKLADVNSDGVVNVKDVTELQRYLAMIPQKK